MTRERRRILWALLISFALVMLFSGIADLVPALGWLGILAAPGMLAAAVFFPQGGHSDWAYAYVILAVVIDALLYTWPVLIAWRFFADRGSR